MSQEHFKPKTVVKMYTLHFSETFLFFNLTDVKQSPFKGPNLPQNAFLNLGHVVWEDCQQRS